MNLSPSILQCEIHNKNRKEKITNSEKKPSLSEPGKGKFGQTNAVDQ
jgi:hypothetical protein